MLAWHAGHWEHWLHYHKVTFDGVQRLIIVNPDVQSLSIKTDIYSAWKEWVRLDDYAKYEPALRTIGGDPIREGVYAGDIYFLINGWKIWVDHAVEVEGVVYSDDGSNPFITPSNANVVRSTASNLALAYGMTVGQTQLISEIRTRLSTLQATTEDLAAEAFGKWTLDFDTDTLTLFRPDGTVLKRFDLTKTLANPPNYIERTPQ